WGLVTGLVGMASKYAAAFLGVRVRTTDEKGNISGGPQRYLEHGIKGGLGKFLAWFFAIAAVIASFGIGNLTQANAVAEGLQDTFDIDPRLTAVFLFEIGRASCRERV